MTVIDVLTAGVYAPLADIVPRVTLFPLLASFWLGGQWGWALGITLAYHVIVALPLRVYLTTVGVNTFPVDEILSKSDLFIQYIVAMPTMAVVSALSGAVVSFLLIMPRHLVPLGHIFTCCWGERFVGNVVEPARNRIVAEMGTPVPDSYKTYSVVVMASLTILGSFLPYEVVVWMYPGAGGSILAICLCIIPPVWSVVVSLIGFYAFNVENLFGYGDKVKYRERAGITVAKIAVVHTLPSVPMYMVIYFRRNYHASWLTFFCFDAALIGLAVFYYVYYGKKKGFATVEYLEGMEELVEEKEEKEYTSAVRLLGTPFSENAAINVR
jgi:hypothetical protein